MSLVVHGRFLNEQRIVARRWKLDYNCGARPIRSAFGSDRATMCIGYASTDRKAET